MASQAACEGATTRTLSPLLTLCRTAAARAVVFPVPGGPCTTRRGGQAAALASIAILLLSDFTSLLYTVTGGGGSAKGPLTFTFSGSPNKAATVKPKGVSGDKEVFRASKSFFNCLISLS